MKFVGAVRAFPQGEITPLLSPRGSAISQFREVASDAVEVRGMSQFDNTRYSHYRGIRWLVLLREIFMFHLRRVSSRHVAGGELVSTSFPPMSPRACCPWLLARIFFNAPVVVHVRLLFQR